MIVSALMAENTNPEHNTAARQRLIMPKCSHIFPVCPVTIQHELTQTNRAYGIRLLYPPVCASLQNYEAYN
jgi:hypothetical protein